MIMEQIFPEPKIDAKQAAQLNGVSAKTIIRWARAGMPHFHFDRQYLFYQSEIEQFMNSTFAVNRNIYSLESAKRAAGARR